MSCLYRICGNTASDKNIHSSVSEQLKKNFAKSKWKVSLLRFISVYVCMYSFSSSYDIGFLFDSMKRIG